MKIQEHNMNTKMKSSSPISSMTWLVAGVGIGALAGLLLAPQSGEDTREWISTQYKSGIDTVNSKVQETTQRVGDWIDESKNQVAEAVSAGREAYTKAKAATP
jgi:gas vesicle protein